MGAHGPCAATAVGDSRAARVAAADPGEVSLVEDFHLGVRVGDA